MKFGFTFNETLPYYFKTVNDGLWESLERGEITSESLYRVRWEKIFEAMGCEEGKNVGGWNFELVFKDDLRLQAIPVEGAVELLSYLSGKYELCVGTNGPLLQQQLRLRSAGMMPYIGETHVFASEDLGVRKPEHAFFDVCLKKLAEERGEPIDISEVLMLGDSLTADIGGAKEYGMTTLWYNHDKVDPHKQGSEKADMIVDSLEEIQTIL